MSQSKALDAWLGGQALSTAHAVVLRLGGVSQSPEASENRDSDSLGLGWGLRICISNKILRMSMLLVQ